MNKKAKTELEAGELEEEKLPPWGPTEQSICADSTLHHDFLNIIFNTIRSRDPDSFVVPSNNFDPIDSGKSCTVQFGSDTMTDLYPIVKMDQLKGYAWLGDRVLGHDLSSLGFDNFREKSAACHSVMTISFLSVTSC